MTPILSGKKGLQDENKSRFVAEKLAQFKIQIQDILKPEYDDFYLTKWLIARQYDVNKAEKMIRDSEAYKKRVGVHSLIENYTIPEVLEKYLPGGFPGYDHDGSLICVETFGRIDIKGLMRSAKRSDLEKTKLLRCEKTVHDWKKQSEKLGKRVDGVTVILDLDGLGMETLWKPGLTMYLHLMKVLEDNYPEMMKRTFIINAPRIFPLLYKISRPLVSEHMRKKLQILSGNYIDKLLEFMDEDQIPKFLGGTQTDPDGNPNCFTCIGHGGKVPESYYLTDHDLVEDMKTATVPRADKLRLSYDVEQVGSVIRWLFKTEEFDIGFGIWRQENGHKIKVVDTQRYNSHIMTEDGSFMVDKPGKYIVCFDNSFSWTRPKKIKYWVDVFTDEMDSRQEH